MGALPVFAGTANPADLATKLDAQRVELDARRVETVGRLDTLNDR